MSEQQEHRAEKQVGEASLLFNKYVLLGVLGCLLLAIWFKLYTLIGVLAFVLVLAAFIHGWNRMSLKHIEVDLDLPAFRVFAGEALEVRATVENKKWLPLVWLEWEFPPSRLIAWNGEPDYRMRLLWLLANEKAEWTAKGKTVRRGVYPVGTITIRSGDGFRFSESEKVHDVKKNVYIYPKLIAVNVPAFQSALHWEVQGKRGGLLEDPLMVSGVRDYEPGDDWLRFNWWASARSGKMKTNVYQPIVNKRLLVLVDVFGYGIEMKYEEEEEKQKKYEERQAAAFERYLSVIASFAVAYLDEGVLVGYASNGKNHLGTEQAVINPQSQPEKVLDALAQLTQQVAEGAEALPQDWLLLNRQSNLPIYLFCRRIGKRHLSFYEHYKETHDIHMYYEESSEFAARLKDAASPIDDLLYEAAVGVG